MDKKREKGEKLKYLLDSGIVAIIRADDSSQLIKAARAIKDGGIKAIEVTMTTPGALKVIKEISEKLQDEIMIGAGSVLDAQTARLAILSGAEFIVCPVLNKEVITLCSRYGVIVLPGAYTPTEILTAWEQGADLVKVFPADIGGPGYIKTVKAPLPQVALVPTGGVNLDNAGDFINTGASAIAVGGSLVNNKLINAGRFDLIQETAEKFVDAVKKARQGKKSNFTVKETD